MTSIFTCIFLLNSLIIPFIKGSLYEYISCCNLGKEQSELNDDCQLDIFSFVNKFHDRKAHQKHFSRTCGYIFDLCCRERQLQENCDIGKNMAKKNISCSLTDEPSVTGCCDVCRLGLESNECINKEIQLTKRLNQVFSECCSSTLSNKNNENKEKNTDNNNNSNYYNNNNDNENNDNNNKCVSQDLCLPCLNSENGICTCYNGFRVSSDGSHCEDIDECKDVNPCSDKCINLAGSYRCENKADTCIGAYCASCLSFSAQTNKSLSCECPNGWRVSPDLTQCIDIDECAGNQIICPKNQYCINKPGTFKCELKSEKDTHFDIKCPIGYTISNNAYECDDIDECKNGDHHCDLSKETCVNRQGSYLCILLNNNNNDNNNNNNSFNNLKDINCPYGYVYNVLDKKCEFNEICKCKPGFECINGICYCPKGFERSSEDKCVDINECETGGDDCLENYTCHNTNGSYVCVRGACGTGYVYNQDTDVCKDINECEIKANVCGPQYECINTPGSFRCVRQRCPSGQMLISDGTCRVIECDRGYHYDETQDRCIDTDECSLINAPCSSYELCINIVGSYYCRPNLICNKGFVYNKYTHNCEDIDECLTDQHFCKNGKQCINTHGGYYCICPDGYKADNQDSCEDINECLASSICPPNSQCINTNGSYICYCLPGFEEKTLDGKRKYCVDQDECLNRPCSHKCYNTLGSYFCDCPQGYKLSSDNRTCEDIDECANSTENACFGECVNLEGSYRCECPNGFDRLSDGRCRDIDECQMNVCGNGNNTICLNVLGSYKCYEKQCPNGYISDPQHTSRCVQRINLCESIGCTDIMEYSYSYIALPSDIPIKSDNPLQIINLRGPRDRKAAILVNLEVINKDTKPGVPEAKRSDFYLETTSFTSYKNNEARVYIVKSLKGPQDLELKLTMSTYLSGQFVGKSVAIINLYISEFKVTQNLKID